MRAFVFSLLLTFTVLFAGCASNPQGNQKSQPVSNSVGVTPEVKPESAQKEEAEKKAADEKSGESKAKYECKKDSDQRVLRAVSLNDGGCEVQYTKAGKTTSVASSSHGMSRCIKVATKMKSNLVKSGFSCQ